MKLQVKKRPAETKNEAHALRREGFIPAVLYSKNNANQNIVIKTDEFHAHLRQIQQGHLTATKFTLEEEGGHKIEALVKDIQYHPVTYNILHIDFMQLHANHQIYVKIPVRLNGTADCVGVKLGGSVQAVSPHFKVKCLPKDIPAYFEIDVADMKIHQSRRFSSLNLPDNVKAIDSLNNVAVIIAKR